MPTKRKLTNRMVADLKPKDKPFHLYDTDVTGFCITVTPNGVKGWYYVGRLNGRARRVKLGPFPEMTATDARDCCRQMVVDAQRGKDTISQRRAGRRTLGDLFELYMTVHAKLKKRTWERDEKEFERYLSDWKNKPLGEIRRGIIADKVADIVARYGKGAAHKARALLSKMFAIGVKHEWVEFNPVTGTDRPTFEPRDRYLKPEEVGKFFAAVDSLQRQTTKDFIRLAIYTGARRSNLCTMRWEEIDLQRAVWTIPREKFKGKRSHEVPLIEPALEILHRRKAERATGNPWVFPGGGKLGHIVEPKAAMDKVREASGIPDIRFHDLRRTLGAWQNNAGVSIRTIQQALGHADIATTAKIYTPGGGDAVRAATAAAVASILEAAENGKAGE